MISSIHNDEIKKIKKLESRKYRELWGLFIIEGKNALEMALDAQIKIESVYYTESLAESLRGQELLHSMVDTGSKAILVTDEIMQKMADTQNPQGVLAIARINKNEDWADSIQGGTILILDRIQDPGNLGTIIRTADSAGVELVIALQGTVDLYNSKVIRSSSGSIFNVPIIAGIPLADVHRILKDKGYRFVAADMNGSVVYYNEDLSGPLAFIFGNEGQGLSSEARKLVDSTVMIPLLGKSESLNVSIACGVLLYEQIRQKEVNRR